MEAAELDSVIRIAEAVDKYGALVMVFAVFLFVGMMFIIAIMRRYQKLAKGKDENFQQLFTELQTQNTEVFSKLMQTAFRTNPPEIVQESITTAGAVRKHLKAAVSTTKADRISVYAFHDGQRMVTEQGHHLLKLSCWTEYTMVPQHTRIDRHKDMQSSRFQEICDTLLKHNQWEALTEKDIEETLLATWGEGKNSIKSAFAHSIYSTDARFIGFVLMEYVQSPVVPSWVETAREECKKLSDKVSITLDMEF